MSRCALCAFRFVSDADWVEIPRAPKIGLAADKLPPMCAVDAAEAWRKIGAKMLSQGTPLDETPDTGRMHKYKCARKFYQEAEMVREVVESSYSGSPQNVGHKSARIMGESRARRSRFDPTWYLSEDPHGLRPHTPQSPSSPA